jgi:preprotein translocase subunit YajC
MDGSFLILIAFFAVMYLLLIRPQQKRQRQHQRMIRSVTVGDDVVTAGGLHGTVAALDDDTMDLTVSADGTVLRFQRSSLARVVDPTAAALDDDAGTADAETADADHEAGGDDGERA